MSESKIVLTIDDELKNDAEDLFFSLGLNLGVTQKSWFRRNRFFRVTPAQFIRYLKSFHKANLDINKPLRLWVFM